MTSFVLVPGAWLGSWVWKKVTPLLREKGHKVYPVTLTGMGDRVHLATKDLGVETSITDVLNVIEFNDLKDFVLVGHSFAGKVVSEAADRVHDKVGTLLFLDAFVPDKVRTPQGRFDPSQEFPTTPGDWKIPFSSGILDAIGKDVQGADREWMLAKCTPWPIKPASDPITLSEKYDSLKRAYIFCTGGGDWPYIEQLVKKGLDGPHKVIESGHWPMVTKPEETVEDMLDLTS